MGGKTIMQFISSFPEMQDLCKGVVIVDIPNVKLKQGKSENSVRNILRVLSEMDLKGKSLQEI
jgi:hypothetical protein